MKTYVLLMMGGVGSRFGADIPKQFTMIDEKPLFSYIVKRLASLEFVNGIVAVVHKDWIGFTNEWLKRLKILDKVQLVEGGSCRSESVYNGLKCLRDIVSDDDVVLMHDATHPYVDKEGTHQVALLSYKYGAATLASLNYDTTYMMDNDNNIVQVVPRQNIIAGASPEGVRYKQIYDIYSSTPLDEMEKMTSVGAIALAHKIPIKVVPTSVLNLKITYQEDMKLFKLLYKNYFFDEQ